MGEQFLSPSYNKNSQQHDQHVQEGEEEENDYDYEFEDEALSLCDLALDDSYNNTPVHHTREPSSSAQPDPLFQFFSDDFSSEIMTMTTMCSADDVIIEGQLLPFTAAEHQEVPAMTKTAQNTAFRKRSKSSPESTSHVKPITAKEDTEKMMRTSRSMGSHMAHHRPLITEVRSTSVRNGSMVVKRTGSSSSSRSKLCFSMFRPVKLPAEMELKDIKSRQLRRSPSNLMTSRVAESATTGGGGSGGAWMVLKALSCKDPRSVGVAASFNS